MERKLIGFAILFGAVMYAIPVQACPSSECFEQASKPSCCDAVRDSNSATIPGLLPDTLSLRNIAPPVQVDFIKPPLITTRVRRDFDLLNSFFLERQHYTSRSPPTTPA